MGGLKGRAGERLVKIGLKYIGGMTHCLSNEVGAGDKLTAGTYLSGHFLNYCCNQRSFQYLLSYPCFPTFVSLPGYSPLDPGSRLSLLLRRAVGPTRTRGPSLEEDRGDGPTGRGRGGLGGMRRADQRVGEGICGVSDPGLWLGNASFLGADDLDNLQSQRSHSFCFLLFLPPSVPPPLLLPGRPRLLPGDPDFDAHKDRRGGAASPSEDVRRMGHFAARFQTRHRQGRQPPCAFLHVVPVSTRNGSLTSYLPSILPSLFLPNPPQSMTTVTSPPRAPCPCSSFSVGPRPTGGQSLKPVSTNSSLVRLLHQRYPPHHPLSPPPPPPPPRCHRPRRLSLAGRIHLFRANLSCGSVHTLLFCIL